jgi:hypothetical protein
MNFKEAYELPIGKYVEKKGKFSYLSWCYAVRHLRENFPEAVWFVKEDSEGSPLFRMPKGWMVRVSVIVDGLEFPQWHPVLDFKNNPILEPNAFEINTSIQRGLTKAIGLATGIGLGLYAGEDLPTEDVVEEAETVDDKKLSVYNEAVGKCKTSDEVNAWMKENGGKIKGELNDAERANLRDTCLKIKIILDTVTDE